MASFSKNRPFCSRIAATMERLILIFSVVRHEAYNCLLRFTRARYVLFPTCFWAMPPRPHKTSASVYVVMPVMGMSDDGEAAIGVCLLIDCLEMTLNLGGKPSSLPVQCSRPERFPFLFCLQIPLTCLLTSFHQGTPRKDKSCAMQLWRTSNRSWCILSAGPCYLWIVS